MKTALFTPIFLEGEDGLGNDRYIRTIRWLDYYSEIQKELGFDHIWMCDNASPVSQIEKLGGTILMHGLYKLGRRSDLSIHTFAERLRKSGTEGHDYPYCWRALYFMKTLIDLGFEKIITIDSDCFVVSRALAKYVRELDSGWTTLWCKKWRFPEASFHVLCKDAFPIFQEFTKNPDFMSHHQSGAMEHLLPFTNVNLDFVTDRYGEVGDTPQTPDMDLYCQARLTTPLEYGKWK